MNQLRNFYIHTISEDSGLLESNVERLIRAKVIADYNDRSRNIAEVSTAASEQAKKLQNREFEFLSLEDIAKRTGILPENLNKVVGNNTLKIPNSFEENFKTFFALETSDFEKIKDDFAVAWKKTVELEKRKEQTVMEHSFETPEETAAKKQEEVLQEEKSSAQSAAMEAEIEEYIEQEKEQKKEEAKRKREEKRRHNREAGAERSRRQREERRREDQRRESNYSGYPSSDSQHQTNISSHRDVGRSFESDSFNAGNKQGQNTPLESLHGSNSSTIDYHLPESDLESSYKTSDYSASTFSESPYKDDKNENRYAESQPVNVSQNMETSSDRQNDSSYHAGNEQTIQYISTQTQTSFTPMFQSNPFQVYSGSLQSYSSSDPSGWGGAQRPTQSQSVEQVLSQVRQDSDTISAGPAKERITSNYSDLSKEETTVTYQGQAVASYTVSSGTTTMEFHSAQEMLQSPYCSDNASVRLTTISGSEVSLSSQEISQLREMSAPEYNAQPISSYYEQQVIENNCFYEGMPVVAIERVQYDELQNQNAAQMFLTTESVDAMYHSISEKSADDLCGEYRMILANGESIDVTPESLQQTKYVTPISVSLEDGLSAEEISAGILSRSEAFSNITGLQNGKQIPDINTISTSSNIESLRASMEPKRALTMQESGLFSSSSPKGATSMMFMSDASEDFTNYSVSSTGSTQLANDSLPDDTVRDSGNKKDNVSLNNIRHREYMDGNFFGALGSAVFQTTCGSSEMMQSIRQIRRYTTSWGNPLAQGMAAAAQEKSVLAKFKKDNQMGRVKQQLRRCGVNTNVLYEHDKLGRKKVKEAFNGTKTYRMKKNLSSKEIQSIMNQLDRKFKIGNAGNVKLSSLSDKELGKLIRSGGKDAELAKAFKNMKDLKNIASKRKLHFANLRHSLKNMANSLLNDAEFYQGIRLVNSYVRVAKRAIGSFVRSVRRTKRAIAGALVKHVRPLRAHALVKKREQLRKQRVKQRKKQEKLRKKEYKKNLRRDKRWEALTGHKKNTWKRNARNKFNESKFGKRVNKLAKKLKPVKVAADKAQSLGAGLFGKLFGGIGKVLNLGNIIKKYLMIGLGIIFFFAFCMLCFTGAILSSMNMEEGSKESSTGSGTLLQEAAGKLVQLDNEWFAKIKEESEKATPQSVTGKKQYSLPDPFTGNKEEITGFGTNGGGKITYHCYDAYAWDTIFNKPNGIDKEKLKPLAGHQINEYSNAKVILSSASWYCLTTNEIAFNSFCKMFWEHSHCYGSSISDSLQICPAKDCHKKTIDCRELSDSLKKTKNISGISYYDDFKGQIGKTCSDDVTYYCNDPASWVGIKYFEKGSMKTPSGQGCQGNGKTVKYDATLFCDWSGKADQNPEPPAEVPKKAKGSFAYQFKDKNSVPSESMDGCKDAVVNKNSTYFDTALIKNDLNVGITLLKKGKNFVKRKVDNKEYYCAYTSNIQIYAKTNYLNKVDGKDGIFLFEAKYIDPKKGQIVPAADDTICTNDRISWFYNCQGHEVNGYTLSYCPGHKGCKGHEVSYCLGHLELEVSYCIAGINGLEANFTDPNNKNFTTVDDLFFNDKKKTYAPFDTWNYSEKWKGFKSEGAGDFILARVEVADWESLGLPDSSFEIQSSITK